MGRLRVAVVVGLVLLAIYAANAVLVRQVAPAGVVDKSGLHYVCRGETSASPQVVFFHSEVGSALEFGWLMEQLAERNVSSCACDRPGYGFSADDAPETIPLGEGVAVVVAKSLGAIYALEQGKKAREMVLLDPLVGESVNDNWSAYRSGLALQGGVCLTYLRQTLVESATG
jgi:pimeloyl-ACP methyl ester carboxylesterase